MPLSHGFGHELKVLARDPPRYGADAPSSPRCSGCRLAGTPFPMLNGLRQRPERPCLDGGSYGQCAIAGAVAIIVLTDDEIDIFE